jgi:hypothetical protein
MPLPKRSIESTVEIDGVSLVWYLHREQQCFTPEWWKGVAIHVRVAVGVRKELHLDYPPIVAKKTGIAAKKPTQPRIDPARVESHIREAMAAGWDPGSRGKPFVYQVGELPG